MKSSLFQIFFSEVNGSAQAGRIFQTLRAARTYAKYLAKAGYASDVKIYQGGAGGMLVK